MRYVLFVPSSWDSTMTQTPSANGCTIAQANVVQGCWPFNTTARGPVSRENLVGHARHTICSIEVEYENLTTMPIKFRRPVRELLLTLAELGDAAGLASALTDLLDHYDTCGVMDSYDLIDQEWDSLLRRLQERVPASPVPAA